MAATTPDLAVDRGPAAPVLRGRRLFWSWTGVVTAGESVGFLVPATAGVASTSSPAWVGVPAVLAAGAVEGAVLGWSQQVVLRRALPDLRRGRWVALTAGAAVAAYVLGFVLALLGGIGTWAAIVAMTAVGAALVATIGVAQTVELHRHVPRAGRWVAWTALAWLIGLAAFLALSMPLWHVGQPLGEAVAVGAAAGMAMALVQAAVTGAGLLRMLPAVTASRTSGGAR